MKISPKDLVKLLIESNNQGYNQAVKLADENYEEFSADFRKAMDEQRLMTEEAFDRGFKAAQGDYQAGRAQGRSEAENPEALAQAKSQAYDRGYARGLAEGQARGSGSENSYNSGLEAGVKAERERALAAEPRLSVWFKPYEKNLFFDNEGNLLPQSPDPAKLKAIKAIREAYGRAEGYSLKEVKDMVEIGYGARYAAGDPLPQSKAVTLYLALQAAGFDPVLRGQE